MFVEPADYRPSTLLAGRPINALSVLGGIASMILVPTSVLLMAMLFSVATGRSILDQTAIGEEPPPVAEAELPVVEAGFVQLGREWDPRELPDRRITSQAEAPRSQDPDVVSAFQRLLTDAGVPPQNRALTALLDTTAAYDQDGNAQNLYEQAGQAWGDAHARDGNMLSGQIISLIRRGLDVPSSIAESDYARIRARVRVVVDSTWTLTTIEFVSGSGNEDWDRAVRQRVSEIASARPRLQPNPGEESGLNQPIAVSVTPVSGRRRSGSSGTGSTPRSTGSSALDSLIGGGN